MHNIKDRYEDPLLDDMVSREVLIDNRDNSNELEDYQVNLSIDEKQLFFEAQDGLRFVDEKLKIINHWNESFPDKQWMKIPKIPSSALCGLRMLDGNPSAGSASNGGNTFNLFDHFLGDAVDTDKWDVTGSPSVANSICTLNIASGIETIDSKTTFSPSTYRVEARASFSLTGSNAEMALNQNILGANRVNAGRYGLKSYTCDWGSNEKTDLGTGYTGYHIWGLYSSGSNIIGAIDRSIVATHVTSYCLDANVIQLRGEGDSTMLVDWVLARKNDAPNEPTTEIGVMS